MKIKKGTSKLIHYFHLDVKYCLLTGKMVKILYEFFRLLDIHNCNALNDIQFYHVIHHMTDLQPKEIYDVFDMLDTDGSGKIDFDEFYLLFCILVAHKDGIVKQFIFRHSRTVFDLLDADGSNGISAVEFSICSYLFSCHGAAIRHIFEEFDVSGDDLLDYREFRMFTMACIDKQRELDDERRRKWQERRSTMQQRQLRRQQKRQQSSQ